jgi:cytochrome c5
MPHDGVRPTISARPGQVIVQVPTKEPGRVFQFDSTPQAAEEMASALLLAAYSARGYVVDDGLRVHLGSILSTWSMREAPPLREEPTTAVETPVAKAAALECPNCGKRMLVWTCEACHVDGVLVAPAADEKVLGWHYVCRDCLGDEATKSIGVMGCPPRCQCCEAAITLATAHPVNREQLERLRRARTL